MISLRARHRVRPPRSPLAAALCIAVSLVTSTGVRAQGKVEELSKVLLEDSSYKVRVQAALVLGKMGNKAASGPLGKALEDENKTVRAIAAQALGQLCDTSSKGALEALLQREQDSFVHGQATKALAALAACGGGPSPGGGGKGTKARIYVVLGPFSGGVKSAGGDLSKFLRDSMQAQFAKVPAISMNLPAGVDEKSFPRSGLLGFFVDGNITRLDDASEGGAIETSCDVKAMVARWPNKSIILWTNAGATVQAGSRPQDRISARRDCFEAVANQLSEDLLKFLKSQGG